MAANILRPWPQLNQTDLLVDENQIFPKLLRLIREARSRIQIDLYLLGGMNFDDIARPNHDIRFKITGPTAKEASAMLAVEWAEGLEPDRNSQLKPWAWFV